MTGPDLTSTCIEVLTRFRKESVVLMSDVEAMFYQVQVPEEDVDLLRFLWWPSEDYTQCMEEYRMTVHLFGATSSPSCANFALRKCAEDNKDFFSQQVFETIMYNFYVDDCLASVASEQEAISLYKDLTTICTKGGFHLTKWISNNRSWPQYLRRRKQRWRKELRLQLQESVFWTDSTSVLKYIKNETSRFRVFVANRVSEILKVSDASQWRFVNTVYNPADLA